MRPAPLLVALLVLAGAARAGAETLGVPTAEGLVLDGRLDEPAWSAALRLASGGVEAPVPGPDGTTARSTLVPDVLLLQQAGRLWIGIVADEDPGLAIGVSLLAGPTGLGDAAEALAVSYTPLDPRSARWVVRGPGGVGRGACAVVGATDVGTAGRWSLELALPLEAAGVRGDDPLALGLSVGTRTPGLRAWSPPEARLAGPATWAVLAPSGGAWSRPPDGGDAWTVEALADEDARDAERMDAWDDWLAANGATVDALLAGTEAEPAPDGTVDPEAVGRVLRRRLVAPLEAAAAARPDLATLGLVRADVLRRLGYRDEADAALEEALGRVPGLREARWMRWLELRGPALAEGPDGGPSDWAAARVAIDAAASAAAEGGDPFAAEGARLGRALLAWKRGDLAEAVAPLRDLAARHPEVAALVLAAERAARDGEAWGYEQQRRRQEAQADDLPRVRLETTRGPVLLELFEDDAPNTVKAFVWLAEHGVYDDTAIDRTVPFFLLQGGDPSTRPGADPDRHGPGWALPSETGEPGHRRLPFRGTVALLAETPNAEGSRFGVFTGAATHLEGDVSVFGRVIEGMEVVDRLVAGDRLVRAEVVRRRPDTTYRPLTVAGEPAPEPR